ncbi:hypothetical protein THMIRHAM_01170 [Thiomicrorhabdus immobilis]|uniref:Uncharacterized protein n=1 Tax=Thiomicrorhabdus immobilis TaxID=2791037 RepID=A0ABM7MAG7_9GAMM|nr:hypothetical protein [Thiomicrorhabdus immobilis]BCN92332.1 hypothetical protein THMIRHAM_01170 [Thiomicrorhabdus immobilis]
MSKRIKPNAEHRIVDGEIIPDSLASIDEKIERGKAYSEQKAEQSLGDVNLSSEDINDLGEDVDPRASISEGIDLKAENKPHSPGFIRKYKSYLFSLVLLLAIVATLYITRPNLDWEIQRINDLQSQIAELRQENSALEVRMQEQQKALIARVDSQLQKALDNPENQVLITQADLSQIKEQTNQQLEKIQEKLASLGGQGEVQVEQALAQLEQLAKKAQQELQPSDEQLKALKEVEQTLQAQIDGFSEKLGELFQFKKEQQVLTKQPPVLKLDMPLDSLQIQQWIVEINTQWILNGRVEETQQQLLALEQAASLSDFAHTTQLARLIGQDLGYLNQVQGDALSYPLPTTDKLKKAVNNLSADNLFTSADTTKPQDAESSDSGHGFDNLLNKFSQMITVKKRPEEGALAEVDGLLMNDVLLQRLGLLIDRLDWGMQTHSSQMVNKASDDIKAFIKRHYAKSFSEFNLLLTPFENVQFTDKQTLSIVTLDQAVSE